MCDPHDRCDDTFETLVSTATSRTQHGRCDALDEGGPWSRARIVGFDEWVPE